MKKFSYKAEILTGLFLYACGAALFRPAVEVMDYTLFLIGLFIIAVGLGCLETTVNPFAIVFDPEGDGYFRLNLTQTFNPSGVTIAVVSGQSLVLSNVPHQPQNVLDKMAPERLNAWEHSLVLSVQTPYMVIVATVLLTALLVVCTHSPSLQNDDHSDNAQSTFLASLTCLMRIRYWRWTMLAQFCYVGAQTTCWSYLIHYIIEEIPGMTADFVTGYLTATMVCFFIGRLTSTWLIRRSVPRSVSAIYTFITMPLCLPSIFSGGHVGLLALTLRSAFMSIRYPIIFSLGAEHLDQGTKYGPSFITMTTIGGGIATSMMGFVSNAAGNILTAELIPALCLAIIFIFARFRS